jgi:integrase
MSNTTAPYNRKRRITLNLTQHASGCWCKKIDGQVRYFGHKGGTFEEARRELLLLINQIELNSPAPAVAGDMRLDQLAEAYAASYDGRIASGHVKRRTFQDYDVAITDFVGRVGAGRLCSAIGPADFSAVAGKWKILSPSRRGNHIQTIRSMFGWAADPKRKLILPTDFGDDFHKPSRHVYRAATRAKDKRKFTALELAVMLRYSNARQFACLLLGINCGMYSADIAAIRWRDIRHSDGETCVDWLRPKTEIPWIAPLWPETIAALPKRSKPGDLVFATKSGRPLVRDDERTDIIACGFDKIIRRAKMKRRGVAFGAVRHTHTSAVNGIGDPDACHLVRGHVIEGMAELYDHVDIPRLKRVADLARDRLLVLPMSTEIPPEVVARMTPKTRGRKHAPRQLAAPYSPAPAHGEKPATRRTG